MGTVIALCLLILLLVINIKHLTKNENLAYGIGLAQVAVVIVICYLDGSKIEGLLPNIMTKLSLFERFYVLVNEVFDMTAIVYDLAVIVFFLFLSVQSLEKRRYN